MKVTSILWLAMAIPQALAVPEPVLRSLYSVDRPRPKQRLGEDPMKNSAFSRKTSPSKDGGTEVFKTMKPLKGSGGLSQRPRPGDSMTDVSLKDKIVLAWREGKCSCLAQSDSYASIRVIMDSVTNHFI